MTETTGLTTTTVFIRNVPVQTYRDIKAGAAAHGLTLKEWLAEALKARKGGDPDAVPQK